MAWTKEGPVSFFESLGEIGILAFGCSYGNFIPLGIPLVMTAFGEAATVPLFLLEKADNSLSTFNKKRGLPNTLTSLNSQNMSFYLKKGGSLSKNSLKKKKESGIISKSACYVV